MRCPLCGHSDRHRSNAQLAYYWAVVVQRLSEHTGYTPDELHGYLKQRFLPKRLTIRALNGHPVETATIPGSTGELTTSEMVDYCATIQRWAAETLDVYIPDPNEFVA